jgi:hypothetical protein
MIMARMRRIFNFKSLSPKSGLGLSLLFIFIFVLMLEASLVSSLPAKHRSPGSNNRNYNKARFQHHHHQHHHRQHHQQPSMPIENLEVWIKYFNQDLIAWCFKGLKSKRGIASHEFTNHCCICDNSRPLIAVAHSPSSRRSTSSVKTWSMRCIRIGSVMRKRNGSNTIGNI